jgi:PAS domain S-box-containing protein
MSLQPKRKIDSALEPAILICVKAHEGLGTLGYFRMHLTSITTDDMLGVAVAAMRRNGIDGLHVLEELPAAIYVTDNDGRIIYFNRACVDFSGRTPVLGEDRWCVTWKLYATDGTPLPHAECPMAVAIREKRAVRGVEAIAERPDGSRVHFAPFPTPLLDENGDMVGAVNLLMDITDRKEAQQFHVQAQRCRRLARSINDRAATNTLLGMAEEYEQRARQFQLN